MLAQLGVIVASNVPVAGFLSMNDDLRFWADFTTNFAACFNQIAKDVPAVFGGCAVTFDVELAWAKAYRW